MNAPLKTEDLVKLMNDQHAVVLKHNETVEGKLAEQDARTKEIEQLLAKSPRGGGGGVAKSWGAQFTASEQYRSLIGPMGRRGRVRLELAVTSDPLSAGALVPVDHRPEIVMLPQQKLRIRSLLAPGTTISNMVEYARQTLRDNNADVVSGEGTLKPESNLEFTIENAPVRTIAHFIVTSKQILDDAAQLQSTIDTEMRYGVALAEETQFLLGDGIGDNLLGIIPQSTAFSAPFQVEIPQRLDTLLQAIAQVEMGLIEATGIAINPLDWRRMQAIKDVNGDYIGGGPFGPNIGLAWQIPVVPSHSVPVTKFLVGGFAQGAQVFDRQQTTVEISTEDDQNFRKNLVTIRAEERVALAVKRPDAFVYGTFSTST